jgi:hypothetical protein
VDRRVELAFGRVPIGTCPRRAFYSQDLDEDESDVDEKDRFLGADVGARFELGEELHRGCPGHGGPAHCVSRRGRGRLGDRLDLRLLH